VNYGKNAALVAIMFIAVGLVGCGSSDPQPAPEASAPAPAAPAAAEAPAADAEPLASIDTLSNEDVIAIGKELFQNPGSNTCNDCHGMEGHGGRLEEAADLRTPSAWKSFERNGGDLDKVKAELLELIEIGAGAWNAKYPDKEYDVNMFGVNQGITKKKLKKIAKALKNDKKVDLPKDVRLSFGAKAAYAYIESIKTE